MGLVEINCHCDRDDDRAHEEEKCLHFDLEFCPFAPFDSGNAEHADQAGGHRREGVNEACAKLVGENSNLPGNAHQVGKGRHDRHGQSRLAGIGGYDQIEQALENVHGPCAYECGNAIQKGSDSVQPQLHDLDAVLAMREAGVNIVGLGYTIYLGSEYESTMMAEAGQLIAQAHANGLLVVLWIYPRGKAVTAEKDPALIAGAAGVALCLGADFVKVNPPSACEDSTSAENLSIAAKAAGRTGLVCAGGSTVDAETFLTQLHDQIHIGGACGNATGRNIHQRSLDEAVRLTKAISAITLADYSVADALAVFNGEKDFAL